MAQPAPHIDVRETALAAATRRFAEDGFAATSLQSLADDVGVSKPTLVYHFGTKADLRREVVAGLLGHWRDALPRMMLAAAGSGPRVDGLLEELFRFFLEDRHRAKLLLRELMDHPDEMQALIREHLAPWTRLLSEAMRAGQDQGVLRRDVDPQAYALLVVTTAVGTLAVGDRAAALMHPEPSLDDQLAELVRIARAALLAPSQP